jgi:hypothetical protein
MRIARNIGRALAVDLANSFLGARYSPGSRRQLRLRKEQS